MSRRPLKIRRLFWIFSILPASFMLMTCTSSTLYPIDRFSLIGNSKSRKPIPNAEDPEFPRVTLTYDEASTSLMAEAWHFPPDATIIFKLWVGARPITPALRCQTEKNGYCIRPMGLLPDFESIGLGADKAFVASAQSLDEPEIKAFSTPLEFRPASYGLELNTSTATSTPVNIPTETPTCTCTPASTARPTESVTAPTATRITPSPGSERSTSPIDCVVCTLTVTPTPTRTPGPTITLVPTYASSTPTHTPLPTRIPSNSHFPYWCGEYFDNPKFQGDPVLVRDDANLAFNWDRESPAPGAVPPNLFSVRWSQKFVIESEGRYTFYLDADDSAVVRINGETLMRYRFTQREDKIQIATRYLTRGEALDIEVEYIEKWGNASVKFWWELATEPPCWHGHYFANADLGGKVVAQEMVCGYNLRKHWEDEDDWPTSLGPDTPFSTCWTRVIEAPMSTDRYRLCLYVKDSARLWLNRTLLIHTRPIDTGPQFICKDVNFGQDRATHVLRLDLYRKSKGDAVLGFYLIEHSPNTPWTGAYFDNIDMTGPPTFIRTAQELNIPSNKQDWDPRIDNGPFSSIWQRTLTLNKGIFHFFAEHDDGIKLTSNSTEIINDWYPGEVRTQKRVHSVTGKENVNLRVEYYHEEENTDPKLHVWWEKATATPTVTPTPSPTFPPTNTPMLTPTPTSPCATPTPMDPEAND